MGASFLFINIRQQGNEIKQKTFQDIGLFTYSR